MSRELLGIGFSLEWRFMRGGLECVRLEDRILVFVWVFGRLRKGWRLKKVGIVMGRLLYTLMY